MNYNLLKKHFKIYEDKGDKCIAFCPLHSEGNASITICYDKLNKKSLIECSEGCSVLEILDKVGLTLEDLDESGSTKKSIYEIYRYTDKNGNELYQKVKYQDGKFLVRRVIGNDVVYGLKGGEYYETFTGSGEWSKKEKINAKVKVFPEAQQVIYNLPQVVNAINKGETVFIVQGEKNVETLKKLGLTGTTNLYIPSKGFEKANWKESYNQYFKEAKVVLIADCHKTGIMYMESIARSLEGISSSIKLIRLEELSEKEGITEWIGKGYTKEDLLRIIAEEATWTSVDILNFNHSDVGNAERLVAVHGEKLRFNPLSEKWFYWNGRYWKNDDDGEVTRLAVDVINRIQRAAQTINCANDEQLIKYKKQVLGFVLKSETQPRINGLIKIAKSQSRIIMKNYDTNPYLLNVLNGTIDLRTGELKQHDRYKYITKIVNLEYHPKAECPNWKKFIEETFMGDVELIEYIQKSIGYSMTGSCREQCFFICYGGGENGKSTFLSTIHSIIPQYTEILGGDSLAEKKFRNGARIDIAKLKEKRFVCANELSAEEHFDETLLKALTGGDVVVARHLYKEEFQLTPQFKLWIASNEIPNIRGTNKGIWRRIRIIPFMYSFPESQKDTNYYENNLKHELNGILAWAVEGCLKWVKEGLTTPKSILNLVCEYKIEYDSVERFINDCCTIKADYSVAANELYVRYTLWCKKNNEENILSNVIFSRKIIEKKFEKSRKASGIFYMGIGIK